MRFKRFSCQVILLGFLAFFPLGALWAGEAAAMLPRGIASSENGADGGAFLPLGVDEAMAGPLYRYHALTERSPSGTDRRLVRSTATFDRDRWRMKNGQEMVFHFRLEPVDSGPADTKSEPFKFIGVMLTVTLDDFSGGRLIAEFSRNGEAWEKIDEATGSGWIQPVLGAYQNPDERPDALWFRFRAEKAETDADFSITGIGIEAMTDRSDFNGHGANIPARTSDAAVLDAFDAEPLFLTDDNRLAVRVENKTDRPLLWNPGDYIDAFSDAEPISLGPNAAVNALYPVRVELNRRQTIVNCRFSTAYRLQIDVPPYLIQDYAASIEGISGETDGVSLSWTDASRKVPKNPRVVEIQSPRPIRFEAAKNDVESFQIVVRPERKLSGLTAVLSDWTGPGGETIPAASGQVRYAYYHEVNNPTDGSAVAGFYPDALVPIQDGADGLGAPLTVEAGENCPLWVTVRVPKNAAAGDWCGLLRVKDADRTLDAEIPCVLHVWNFALPEKNRIRTAFGFSANTAYRYHRCATDEEKRIVFDKYMQSFADHRLSPYDPTDEAEIKLTWRPETNPPSCDVDFSRFDRRMDAALAKYPFTDFRIDPVGLYHNRPFAGFEPGSETYEAMYADYLRKYEKHLEEKGWLDTAYCYWTDEPFEKDYGWVTDGFALLSQYAPKIRRMLTEEPSSKLIERLEAKGTNVDIWCPVSYLYNDAEARKRMAKGERLWWYVCCGPVAPYCTEFTDHPALELRVWLWQTYQRAISGVLIWTTNYWTNDQAYPETAQNPYLDPMCYASGPGGMLGYFGNGDGRFIYPPLKIADAGRADAGACLDGPVESIRWEMLREGIEDYEMLTTLAERLQTNGEKLSESERSEIQELLTVPKTISESMTVFTDDPNDIYQRRAEIARAIERLQ